VVYLINETRSTPLSEKARVFLRVRRLFRKTPSKGNIDFATISQVS